MAVRRRRHGALYAPAAGIAEIRRAPADRKGRRPEGQPPGEAGAAAVAGRERRRGPRMREAPGFPARPLSEERPRLWRSPLCPAGS